MTSYLFPDGKFSLERLKTLSEAVGKDNLVVDVRCESLKQCTGIQSAQWLCSCRRRGDKWLVAMNKWQDITDVEVCKGTKSQTIQNTTPDVTVVRSRIVGSVIGILLVQVGFLCRTAYI